MSLYKKKRREKSGNLINQLVESFHKYPPHSIMGTTKYPLNEELKKIFFLSYSETVLYCGVSFAVAKDTRLRIVGPHIS